ncbi:MAG: S-layer protein [uncultured bacterium]|nr:MAG: S-layer protein [uncultured bacterium]KKT02556.1 MAG: 5'-nucleotidase [Candidatus Peregrinibacteria bacterium GW2011_GWF2_43_17]KKT20551.1 MAG: Cellulosome-anchoring protein [Candidatus Peregrinibacteria bacterium GW2011_GWA2_43_8]HAU39930.1 hypothetical protein [Candidatus Peregrinibacteria bacterium]
MKKFLCSILVACMLVPLAKASFTDVSEGYRYYAAITFLEDHGIIEGYSNGTFKPDQKVTRAEALKIILLGSGIEIAESGIYEFPFSDLEDDAWYLKYINEAYSSGIVNGYDDNTFKPGQNINLAEVLKILLLANKVDVADVVVEDSPYNDVGIGVWYAPYAEYAKSLNLIEPLDDGLMHAEYEITRAELAEIIYRLMYIDEKGLSEFDISTNWQYYQNELGYLVKYPYDWQIINVDDGSVILWNRDEGNNQTNWEREYPNSAKVVLAVNPNAEGLSDDEFFSEVIAAFDFGDRGIVTFSESYINGMAVLQFVYEDDIEKVTDTYMYLDNGTVLAMYGSCGKGFLFENSYDEIFGIEMSAEYVEDATTTPTEWEAVLEEARSLIQVDDMGTYVLSLFSDKVLIETDTIGVGTGPVDYYYSAGADVTLKHERSYDVILDIQEGSTTAF